MKIKILSWNIWVDCDMEKLKTFLKEADADIVGLQEVRENDAERDVVSFMSGLGYKNVFAPEQKWGDPAFRFGPAIFSRFDIVRSTVHRLSEQDPRFAIEAVVAAGETHLNVFSTHLSHTHQQFSDVQNTQATTLADIAPKEKTLIMGDLNATPGSEPVKILSSAFVNTDPSNAPTWSVYPEGCPKCLPQAIDTRLDYIFASKDLLFSDATVGRSEASDHLPIFVTVEL